MPYANEGSSRRRRLPRDQALVANQETFAPIELDPKVSKHLRRVNYEGDSPLKGRVHEIRGWDKWTMAQRIAFLRSFVEDTARDPAIAEKATQIVREASVKLRDHQGEWAALLKWVQQNIRFTAEPKERIQSPQYTLTKRYGDCLPAWTLVMTRARLEAIQSINVGDEIWGLKGWTAVTAVWDKGVLATTKTRLSNGEGFRSTSDHKVCRATSGGGWETVTVADLVLGDVLTSPTNLLFGQQYPFAAPNSSHVSLKNPPPEARGKRPVRVVALGEDPLREHCFDLTTEEGMIYLPTADISVHNCDDLGITLAALGYSLRLPFKFVLSGKHANGKRVRWVEGSGRVPPGVNWTHIYVQAQWPPFRPTTFAWAEPTLDVPLGFDATTATSIKGRADLGETSEDGGSLKKLVRELPWMTIGASVIGSVISAVVVGTIVRPAIEGRRPLRSARKMS